MEAAFLCKAEQEHEWPKFSQVHSIFHYDDCMFLALYFRGGPTLQQCFQFSKTKFGHGSAGRLAEDVLQIIRTVHRLGYMMRSLDLDQFHFDAASRHLFMADISDLRRSTDNNGETIGVSWIGCQLFAPLSHNFGVDQSKKGEIASLHQRDEFEAWFYMFVYLVKDLPWDGLKVENLMWTKVGSLEEKIFENLPQQYRDIFAIINDEPSDKPITDDEFNRITLLVKEIYQKVGGIADHEENFDFERDPTEDELPRFVAERVLNNTKEESVNHE